MRSEQVLAVAAVLSLLTGQARGQAAEDDDWDEPPLPPPPMVMPDWDTHGAPGMPLRHHVPHRWIWRNLTAGRVNALGLTNQFNTGYQRQIFDRPGLLFEQTYAALLVHNEVSPAFSTVGVGMEIQPLAILNLAVRYEGVYSLGTFNFVQSFTSPAEDYSDSRMKDVLRPENTAVPGDRWTLSARLQAKVGPVAVRNQLTGINWRHETDAGEEYFYSPTTDIMHHSGSWVIMNDLDVLYFLGALRIGARYSYTQAFYPDDVDDLGDPNNLVTTHHRVGPAIAVQLWDQIRGNGWHNVTLAVMAQWWAQHRYRTGLDSPTGLPMILIALSQQGDFLPL